MALHLKQQIATTCQAMLDGSLCYLAGTVNLIELREQIGAYENDPDFIAFVALMPGIHELPIHGHPKTWSKGIRKQHQAQINETVQWAKELTQTHCHNLIKRYSQQASELDR